MGRAAPGIATALATFLATMLASLAASDAQTATQARARPATDWPCKSVKVAEISLAAVWSGPALGDTAPSAWRQDAAISALLAQIAPRRMSVETAELAIHDFAASAGASKREKLLVLFAALFDTLAHERAQVVAGLDRFGHRQKELADALRAETAEMRAEQDKPDADAAKLQSLTDRMVWDLRIFEDKRKSVSYVCETPVLIEQRLFALGRAIAKELE